MKARCGRLALADERRCLQAAKLIVGRHYPMMGALAATVDLPLIKYVWTIRALGKRARVFGYLDQGVDTIYIAMKWGRDCAVYTLIHELQHWLHLAFYLMARRCFRLNAADAALDEHPLKTRDVCVVAVGASIEEERHTRYARRV
jgi:hypothetical protein